MTSSKDQNPARAHHYVPRHYLRGFASQDEASRVWVYERGKKFNPGHQTKRHSPLHMPIKNAAMKADFYACVQEDGTIDFETYEKALARRENDDALLLSKIRRGEVPSEQEKLRFARYMVLMHRRTPAHQELFPTIWQTVLNEMRVDTPLLRALDLLQTTTPEGDVERHAKIAAQRQNYDDIIAQRLGEKPSDIMRLDGLLNESPTVVSLLAEMNWHVLRAPKGMGFLAADDPVFLRGGIEHAKSEVCFPLSTSMALIAAWTFKESFQIEDANREQVDLINHVMMTNSAQNIFYFQDSQPLLEKFNTSVYVPFAVKNSA